MANNIQIVEKPDWVSWDEIHDVLWKAHEQNRQNGMNMTFAALPGEEIRKKIEGCGKMFVAQADGILVGTGAVIKRRCSLWCGKGDYAYLCFASVLQDYSGKGIYKSLSEYREREANRMGMDRILFETHENNDRILSINSRVGYKCVDFKVTSTDHYNVLAVKWLNGCPYSDRYVRWIFLIRKWYIKFRYKPGRVKRFGI